MQYDVANYVGLIGVAMVLLAYAMNQAGKWVVEDLIYSITNLIGSILLLISLLYHWNLASVVIEVAWISISLFGVWGWTCRRRRK